MLWVSVKHKGTKLKQSHLERVISRIFIIFHKQRTSSGLLCGTTCILLKDTAKHMSIGSNKINVILKAW